MKQEIVILDPSLDQAVAIAKYLKKFGNYKIIGCFDYKKLGILSKFDNHKYFDEIIFQELNHLLFDKYSIIIPVGASSALNYFKSANICTIGEVDFKKENLVVSDKIYMLNLCKQLNIPIPKTYEHKQKIEKFPVFCKSRYEISDTMKIRKILKSESDINSLPHSEVIIQEYINNLSTFGVGFIAKNGKIITHFIHKELISDPISGGSGVLLEKIDNKQLYNYTSVLLDALNYTGWGLAEFKYVPTRDEYVFMEINAKFWASLEFSLLCNPDFGKLLFGIEYPAKPRKYFAFINRLIVTYSWHIFRYLPQIIVSYKSISGSWRKLLVDFLNHWAGVFIKKKK